VISVFHKSVRDWFTDGDKLKDKLEEHERNAFLVEERQGHALLCHSSTRKLYAPQTLQHSGAIIPSKPSGVQPDADLLSSYRSLPAFASSPPVYGRGLTVQRQSSMLHAAGSDKRGDTSATESVMPIPPRLAVEEVLSTLNMVSTTPASTVSSSSASSMVKYSVQHALVHACLGGDVVSIWSLVCSLPYMELRTRMGQTHKLLGECIRLALPLVAGQFGSFCFCLLYFASFADDGFRGRIIGWC
jgi:hypothetical protein